MRKRMNRREALKAAAGALLSAAIPSSGEEGVSRAARDGGMGFVSDTGERFHLAGDGWALALSIADQYGWPLESWSLSSDHERWMAEMLAQRVREVETIQALRDSGEDFTDLEEDELDLADFREEVRQSCFSPARATGLAIALQKALNDPSFEDLVAACREPARRVMEQALAASDGHARRAVAALAEELECKDFRGRLEAFVAFCQRGGFRLDVYG